MESVTFNLPEQGTLRALTLLLFVSIAVPDNAHAQSWPPKLNGANNGTVTLKTDDFLKIPESVVALRMKDGTASFIVAKTAPTVDLAFHRNLGTNAVSRRLWSSWGDIGLASDGRVYCGIGDHGNAVGGDARCFIYCWDPKQKTLTQVVDMNVVIPPGNGQPAWSKVHAKIDEGADGAIYFCCTLNDGNRAKLPTYKWNKTLPGAQLYRYDPATGKTTVFANLPPKRCTATSILDRKRNIWWCNLEAGEGNALWGLDLKSGKPVAHTPDGTIAFNRNFALAADGSIHFNGENSIHHFHPTTGKVTKTDASFIDSPGMRCSTRESKAGHIYGITHKTSQLFRYTPTNGKLKMLGPNWLAGSYTTVCLLSPDERFLYYLPGSHGKAYLDGTAVIQYEIATARRKVLAFLAPPFEKHHNYVPAGTYGVKLTPDGRTLYINFNGHAADGIRPEKMRPNGFGLTAFAVVQIPQGER